MNRRDYRRSMRRFPIARCFRVRHRPTPAIRPAEKEGAKPILQALTLQLEGHREITVERDDEGRYVVESPRRSTAR